MHYLVAIAIAALLVVSLNRWLTTRRAVRQISATQQAAAAITERVGDTIEARALELVEQHKATLLTKYRASLTKDDYGKVGPSTAWDEQASYFVRTVLMGDAQIRVALDALPFAQRQAVEQGWQSAKVFERDITKRMAAAIDAEQKANGEAKTASP